MAKKKESEKKETKAEDSEPKAPTLTERVEVIEAALQQGLNLDLRAIAEKLGSRS